MTTTKKSTLAALTAEVASLQAALAAQADELATLRRGPADQPLAPAAPGERAAGCSEFGHRWRCLARRIIGTYHSELTAWECERCGIRETQQWDWGP